MDDMLRQILTTLNSLNDKCTALDEKITNIEAGQAAIEKKINDIYDVTSDLREFRTSTSDKLMEIQQAVRFLKHKMRKNEEEIFHIKTYLKLAK